MLCSTPKLTVDISGYSHFFGFNFRWGAVSLGPIAWICGDSTKLCWGHGNCQKGAREVSILPLVGIFSVPPVEKGIGYHTGGAVPRLIQERKAEYEECP